MTEKNNLYVSPDLQLRWTNSDFGTEIIDGEGRCYRLISPDYVVWLEKNLRESEIKAQMGHISAEDFAVRAANFKEVKAVLIRRFGEPSLERARKDAVTTRYEAPVAHLYVNPHNLYRWFTSKEERSAKGDILIGNLPFRKVDPEYYAWLRHRMNYYNKQHNPSELWDKLVVRFNAIHKFCVREFKEEILTQSYKAMDPNRYRVPQAETSAWKHNRDTYLETIASKAERVATRKPSFALFPPEGRWTHSVAVSNRALEKVDKIRKDALARDWSELSLYQNRSNVAWPFGHDYGLATFLKDDDEITEVTREAIYVKNRLGAVLRYANPAVIEKTPYVAKTEAVKEEKQEAKKRAPAKPRAKKPKGTVVLFGEDQHEEYET